MSEPDTQPPTGPVTPHEPIVSNYGLALTVYILYLVGFFTGITVFVGLVIAYLQRDRTDRISQSHFQFQITPSGLGFCIFRWPSDSLFCSGCSNLALVGSLDRHQVRQRNPCLEQG